MGSFTAKDAKKASHSQVCICGGKSWASNCGMLVVPASQYIAMIASSISSEPASV